MQSFCSQGSVLCFLWNLLMVKVFTHLRSVLIGGPPAGWMCSLLIFILHTHSEDPYSKHTESADKTRAPKDMMPRSSAISIFTQITLRDSVYPGVHNLKLTTFTVIHVQISWWHTRTKFTEKLCSQPRVPLEPCLLELCYIKSRNASNVCVRPTKEVELCTNNGSPSKA